MPSRAEYQRIPQSNDDLEEEEEEDDVGETQLQSPQSQPGRRRPSGKIDIRALDKAFKRWEKFTNKLKRKKKKLDSNSKKEIVFSVFQPVPVIAPLGGLVKTLDHNPPMTHDDFEIIVNSVKTAILDGVHPKMIAKGSSGSYYARAKKDGCISTVGVFKPKDEEPYGRLNPKTTKWIHRNLFWWVGFGRSCLIPNLSYISEAAASLLDNRLNLYIVPHTELVSLSSPAFFYDWIDRVAAKKGKPLPDKIGSMQCFQHGYQDASVFLRKHPWPGRSISDTFDDSTHRTGTAHKRFLNALGVCCGKTGEPEDEEDYLEEGGLSQRARERESSRGVTPSPGDGSFSWTPALQQNFREELEKLIILDILMRNTDRGLDNFMIKYCPGSQEKCVVDVAPSALASLQMPAAPPMSEVQPPTSSQTPQAQPASLLTTPPRPAPPEVPYTHQPHLHIAAIDNSLSFPHQHPKGWRSYTYGWLFLPVSLIGRPFSENTRKHFLPLLSDPEWWAETTFQLRKLMSVDPDFHPKMFARQMAVMKGQGWNIVQSLKHSDEGPLELTRRVKVMVWDEEVEVSSTANQEQLLAEVAMQRSTPASAAPAGSDVVASPVSAIHINVPPSPERHHRSRSVGGRSAGAGLDNFPPPRLRRASTDRPVPFAGKLQRGIFPGASGVAVLEHMERLDAVESGLKKLGRSEDDPLLEEEEEDEADDVVDDDWGRNSVEVSGMMASTTLSDGGYLSSSRRRESLDDRPKSSSMSASGVLYGMSSPPQQHGRRSMQGDDARDMIRSMDLGGSGSGEGRKTRIVIAERLETVDAKAFFSIW
ncbi:hypothetical protein BOTBODRAFT_31921 [Botryobasidium botryosum FD-172 SS1]|uniref:Phosphatidylinositol 4-kinase n=1 Tax=Botryobasidium botryosum (strain FD-172 SS1) TaxID=930990 RepID=A0A067MHL0_BOTB1|nr:hypothetical protein BOTBODRAFT_31921 [Botryobasidium botryosum FD-172 SS1]